MSNAVAGVTPRLEVANLSKTFGSFTVLKDINLDVRPGEIHALIGQNGSGKSTLAKILTGMYTPDPGARVAVDGADLSLPVRIIDARDRGVAVVHQNMGLVGSQSVLENMRVGRLKPSRFLRKINWKAETAAVNEVFDRMGRAVPLDAKVDSLLEEERATVAIARALQDARDGAGLIIFDESTRALGRKSLEHFFEILDQIVATGTAVLMITHRLEEVVDAADRVTVLRDGRMVVSGQDVGEMSEHDLAELMLGHSLVTELERDTHEHPAHQGEPVSVRNLSGLGVNELSLDIYPGEVVGVTGIAGSGYDDVPYLLAGVSPAASGTAVLPSGALELTGITPGKVISAGVTLVPEGRETAGLAMSMSVQENVAFGGSARTKRSLRKLRHKGEHDDIIDWSERLDIKPRRPEAAVRTLSGGNQQKVLLAKWLALEPSFLLLHEPTQAVDVGARATIVEAVRKAAREYGCAVLVAGTDENELALLCDRVLFFENGRVVNELNQDITPDKIVEKIYAAGSRLKLRNRAAAPSAEVSPN